MTITKRIRRTMAQLGPARLILVIVMMVAALFVARYSSAMPLIIDAERALYDARATIGAPLVGQDQRITMVTYTDEVLIERRVRSPLDRALLADALKSLDQMGPQSIGIDILFDQATDDDDKLAAQLRAMRTPTFIAYAEPATNPNNIQHAQAEFLQSFLSRATSATTRPASIRLEPDLDDSMRRWPAALPGMPPALSLAMANTARPANARAIPPYRGAIRYRLPAHVSVEQGVDSVDVFDNVPITTFTDPALMTPENIPLFAEQVRGRHILIGGDIIDTDEFTTPLSLLLDPATGEVKKTIGLEVHAHMLAQILDGARLAHVPGWALWLAALVAVLAGALTAVLDFRPAISALLLLAQMAVIAVIPLLMQMNGFDTLDMPVVAAGIGWLLAFIGAGSAVRAVGAEERAFAQSALGKYLPRDIAQEILRDPERLALHGEKRAIHCLFSDLEGFTQMSHAMTPEQVAFVLNAYLDTLSAVVLAHGGTIDKFVGDAVVAFWGAPIARPDDADQAARALLAMARAGDAFSRRMAGEADGTLPPIGRTRVGLHYGEAVVGNFGGDGRMQYTALGDSMNTAARLESANKSTKTCALVSAEALERCSPAERAVYVPMGRITLRGRQKPVDIFEPRPDLSEPVREQLSALIAAHAAGKGADYHSARGQIALACAKDRSIIAMLKRLDATDPGGSYAIT